MAPNRPNDTQKARRKFAPGFFGARELTRDEFIDEYMKKLGISEDKRTPQGFTIVGTQPRHALPYKDGWKMVEDDNVETYIKAFVLPDGQK